MIDSYYVVEAPKWYVWVATVLGLAGIWWGFGKNNYFPWSLIAFIAGCILFGYALWKILPWTITLW